MTENQGFDDTGGLVFIGLIGFALSVGMAMTPLVNLTDSSPLPRLVLSGVLAIPVFVLSTWLLVMIDPYNARELLMGEE